MIMVKIIRKMQQGDIENVVKLHLCAFSDFFLTFLGSNFLHELYKGILMDESGVGLVFIDDQRLTGFVCGSVQPKNLYKRLLKQRWVRFVWAALPSVLRAPLILPRLLRALNMPTHELPFPKCATLMSIAVDPMQQGQGIGKALVRSFVVEAKQRFCRYINLTTDAEDNESTNQFYINLGFIIYRSYQTPEGRVMNEYIKEVN